MKTMLFLFGYERLQTDSEHAAALLSLCLEEQISYTDFEGEDDGGIRFSCLLATAKKLRKKAAALGIPVWITAKGGLPLMLWQRRRRVGLMLGGLCAVFLFWASGQFVWDVRVTGNEQVSTLQIKQELAACGLQVGSYLPQIDPDVLENRVLLASDSLSWISVRMDGTVAEVQVIERVTAPKEPPKRPANLVARCDGQIEYVELFKGDCVIKVGQAVRKGELLVSGVYDSQTVGYRVTRAAGRVMARTEHTYRVEIPLSYTERCYTHLEKGEIYLNFFQKSMKIFKSTGNEAGDCDIIETVRSFSGFGPHTLPVSLLIQERRYYEEVARTRTPEEALDAAYEQLAWELGSLSEDTQLLRKDIETTLTQDTLILTCTVLCLENIAEQVEFEWTEMP